MPRRDEYEDDDYDYDDRPRPRRDDHRDHYDDDENYDDYDRPRRRGGRDAAAQRVTLPAIFLMIAGGLGLALGILNAVLEAAGMNDGPNPFLAQGQQQDPAMKDFENAMKVVGPILNIVWGLIVITGGFMMKSLKGRGFVLFSCVWAMLPCNGCCLFGLPLGIWALVVVCDEHVKRAFYS